ncbi:hypothetical protein [Microbacterium sp.]|uniref:hypothetical protein n=1 Tax=Microbacterium sp. TaxID=51671 RepID=UPI0032213BAB
MTVREILGVIARRWYTTVVALGLAAFLAWTLLQDGGIYSTRAVVDFRWPGAARIEPDNGFTNESVISFADMVARKVNDGHEPSHYSQDDAPLYGAGIRETELVGVAFSGNQWVTDNPVAAVTVQVVGRSAADVQSRRTALIDEVVQTAEALQAEVGASAVDHIIWEIEPLPTAIQYIEPTRVSRTAALAAMGVAGVIGGVGSALLWERVARYRRSRAGRTAGGMTA